MISSGRINKLIKKEAVEIQKEHAKLEASVGGIKDMKGLPDAIFVIDVKYEKIAVLEASRTAIFSYLTSITNIASGNPFISLIPPTLASSFACSFCISTASFFINLLILPDEIISSISNSLLMDPLIVFQLVNVPPSLVEH